nr:hypothetical protein [Tanacetum cinerariifolium]
MGNVKKSVAERAHHQRQYERRVNNRQMQTQESKIDSGSALDVVSSQALDADLVVMESNGTESGMHDTSSSSGNYITHVVDANIRPVNDQLPFAEVNSRAKVQSPKNRNINKHIEPESHTQKPGRQIAIGQRFSLNKSSAMSKKPNTPRSYLSTTKVDSELPNGSNEDITNPYECKQSLDVSAYTLNLSAVPAAVATLRAVDLAGSLSSTTIDQDVPSASSSPTT